MIICEFCGNDEATVNCCLSCIAPDPGDIAPIIALSLGGPVEDARWLAEDIAERLGWDRPSGSPESLDT